MTAKPTQGDVLAAVLLGMVEGANDIARARACYPDLIGHTIFFGPWLALLDEAAAEAVRLGKTPEEAAAALAFAVGAQLEGEQDAR